MVNSKIADNFYILSSLLRVIYTHWNICNSLEDRLDEAEESQKWYLCE